MNVCTPKISVIIPIYNTEEYLRQCLDSIVNQTLPEIEVLCVDDNSTDSSAVIVSEYASRDQRVKLTQFTQTKSAFCARKAGVMQANGEYILFVDSDDYLEPDACERIYQKAVETQVDILHFSSQVENCADLPEARIRMNEDLIKPLNRRLYGHQVFNECFVGKNYGFTLWNKLFKASICKLALAEVEDQYLPKAQDLYTYFVISYSASSYLGWNGKPYYHYCLGRGVTASAQMSVKKFERYCRQADVVEALSAFCRTRNIKSKEVANAVAGYKKQWQAECVRLWMDCSDRDVAAEWTQVLFRYWSPCDLLEIFTDKYWYARNVIAKKIVKMPGTALAEKTVRTIAIYYYHFNVGGVQRVLSLMIPMLKNMGYRVVLITDKVPTEHDFDLDRDVQRVVISDYQKTKPDNYGQRIADWCRIVDEQQIDLILYHAWTSPLLLWDIICLKSRDVSVVVQCHSVFSYSLINLTNDFATLPSVMPLADGVVVLSKTDELFWSVYNDHVYRIPNPVDPVLRNVAMSKGTEKNIVWIGRFSNEKQPWKALKIMEYVHREVPDAILHMVGDAADASVIEKYRKMALKSGLAENTRFWGFREDVSKFLSQACVNLITSTYEGYPMVLIEAQAHGVPTVMYDMPYLDLCRREYGSIAVEPDNDRHAAREIIALLKDVSYWQKNSSRAKQSFDDLCSYDYAAAWKTVLEGKCAEVQMEWETRSVVSTIIDHYRIGWLRRYTQELNPSGAAMSDEAALIRASVSYKVGRIITFVPRKIRGGIRCYQEHGFRYTIQRLLVHLHLQKDSYQ